MAGYFIIFLLSSRFLLLSTFAIFLILFFSPFLFAQEEESEICTIVKTKPTFTSISPAVVPIHVFTFIQFAPTLSFLSRISISVEPSGFRVKVSVNWELLRTRNIRSYIHTKHDNGTTNSTVYAPAAMQSYLYRSHIIIWC